MKICQLPKERLPQNDFFLSSTWKKVHALCASAQSDDGSAYFLARSSSWSKEVIKKAL
jgi:hypothetical protein